MELEAKVGLHNEFFIEVVDKDTGEIKQTGHAYNIVLNQMYTRLCSFASYFVNIHYGTGTGSTSASRTSLFTHLGTKTPTDIELMKDVANNNIYWKRRIQIMSEEHIGSTLTEVGIAFGSTNTNLVTHALIKDSVGNQISIVKTDTDVINIYATVYIVLGNNYSNVAWTTTNQLVNYLVGNTTFPTQYFHLGKIGTYNSAPVNPLTCELKLGSSASLTWTANTASKKVTSSQPRIDINTANGAVREIGVGYTESSGFLRIVLPVTGVYTSDQTTNEPLGTGDGSRTTWTLANPDASNIQLKVDSSVVSGTSSAVNLSPNVKLRNPDTLPAGTGKGCSLSSDGVYLAVPHDNSPFITIYKRTGDSFAKLGNPDILPAADGYGCSWSSDGVYLAVAHYNSPFITIYKRTGDSFAKLNNPDTLPVSHATGCSWSSDGVYLAVAHANSPFITIYKRTGDSFAKLGNPDILPASTGLGCSWSSDGVYLAVAHANSPFITIYKRTGDSFAKLGNPDILPASDCYGCSLSSDGVYLAVTHGTSPFITIYKRTGDSFAKLGNPDILPASTGRSCSLSSDGVYLAVTHGTSLFITIYKRTGDSFAKLGNPDILPASTGLGCSWSSDGVYLAVAHGISPFITIYKRTGQQTSVTFNTPPAVGTTAKASYTVDYIPKDTNRVIDLKLSIQFGEVV